ncbi:hypothetical protein A0J61_01317 [Choanephora cucurbitarum]|uniref:F-box/LRR-repeat protein 15-like leucin rich repeat domain-containing protein n=1 Tax=Choanephora cucurbitarum TaxID=101091 RepID=A0A1C7NNH6_9FUNG|nr:hypothetical protein A0J61_01317 [Choanephora cucurbitarum]
MEDVLRMATVNYYWNTVTTCKIYKHPIITSKRQLNALVNNLSEYNQGFIECLDLTAVHQYVTDPILYAFLRVTHLKQLNLSNCTYVSPAGILPLIKSNVSQLQKLTLTGCTLSTEVLEWIGEAIRQQLYCLSLRNTMIKPCKTIDTTNHLDTMLYTHTNTFEANLRELDLSYCCWVNEETLNNIAHKLPYLEHIVLQWCNQIKASSIHSMVKRLTYLSTIDIRHISTIDTFEQACNVMQYTSSIKKIVFTHKATSFEIIT